MLSHKMKIASPILRLLVFQTNLKKGKSYVNFFRNLTIFMCLSIFQFSYGQETITELLSKHNSMSVPYISVQELAMPKTEAIILDAREQNEYNVSHIKDAIYIGYSDFNIENIKETIPDTSVKLVVYCSLGIRSEAIGEQLKKLGYTNVYNLYGGIFEWKNKGFTVYDANGQPTENVHAYSEEWSPWLLNGTKIYD